MIKEVSLPTLEPTMDVDHVWRPQRQIYPTVLGVCSFRGAFLPVCPFWAAENKAEVRSCWRWLISIGGSWLSSIDNKVTFPWEAAWSKRVCPSSRGTGSPQVSRGTMEGRQPVRGKQQRLPKRGSVERSYQSVICNLEQSPDTIQLKLWFSQKRNVPEQLRHVWVLSLLL